MNYEFYCHKCNRAFIEIRHHTAHRDPAYCICGELGERKYSISRPIIDKTNPEYYHSFGTVVKSKHHRNELMKIHNVEEIGNEKPDIIYRENEKTRQHIMDQRWEKALDEVL